MPMTNRSPPSASSAPSHRETRRTGKLKKAAGPAPGLETETPPPFITSDEDECTDSNRKLKDSSGSWQMLNAVAEMRVLFASLSTKQDEQFGAVHASLESFKVEVRREMEENRVKVTAVSDRMDVMEQRMEALEQREEAPPAPAADVAEVVELKRAVVRLEQELGDRDQEALLADLEIGHLPEERGENVLHSVTVLAAKLGVRLDERDVVFAERVGAAPEREAAVDGAEGAGAAGRGRRVVVRLARRSLRDELLRAARVRRSLTAADAGRADSASSRDRIFLNERLTRSNRQLFHRVREESRKLQWRYAWTKRGRIYVRQADGKPAFPIRSDMDFQRVFGQIPV